MNRGTSMYFLTHSSLRSSITLSIGFHSTAERSSSFDVFLLKLFVTRWAAYLFTPSSRRWWESPGGYQHSIPYNMAGITIVITTVFSMFVEAHLRNCLLTTPIPCFVHRVALQVGFGSWVFHQTWLPKRNNLKCKWGLLHLGGVSLLS